MRMKATRFRKLFRALMLWNRLKITIGGRRRSINSPQTVLSPLVVSCKMMPVLGSLHRRGGRGVRADRLGRRRQSLSIYGIQRAQQILRLTIHFDFLCTYFDKPNQQHTQER
jgi:hypothetical protein